jgi:hypothetical protein
MTERKAQAKATADSPEGNYRKKSKGKGESYGERHPFDHRGDEDLSPGREFG